MLRTDMTLAVPSCKFEVSKARHYQDRTLRGNQCVLEPEIHTIYLKFKGHVFLRGPFTLRLDEFILMVLR